MPSDMIRNMLEWYRLQPLDLPLIGALRDTPGVFRLSYKSADNQFYVFFVGTAPSSLKEELRRILVQTENSCIKTHLDNLECYFRFAYLPSDMVANDIERTLYEKFKPRCNLSVPGGQIIEINFD